MISVVVFNIILPPPAQFSRGLAFEPPFLNAILYTVFLAFTSFMVGYISFKSYMQNGWMFLVLMGSGALAWGSTALLSGWLTNLPSGPNAAITISNTGALVASIFHTASATWSKGPSLKKDPRIRRSILLFAYSGVLAFTALFAAAALEGLTPLFFVPGVGQTTLRMGVLGSAAALFAVSSIIFAKRYFSSRSRSRSSTLYWYFLALGLTGVGLAAVFFGRAPGDPISWTGRTAMFLGGVYFLKAVHTAFKGIGSH